VHLVGMEFVPASKWGGPPIQEPDSTVPQEPTHEDISGFVRLLVAEADHHLSSDVWGVDTASQDWGPRQYLAGALRHVCRLLYELQQAAAGGLETTVWIVGRTHSEAWLVAMYLFMGGDEAFERVQLQSKKEMEKHIRQIEEFNAKAAKTGRAPIGLSFAPNVDQWIKGTSKALGVLDMLRRTDRLAREQWPEDQSYEYAYHNYRLQSAFGTHVGAVVLQSYWNSPVCTDGGLLVSTSAPTGNSTMRQTLEMATYLTAFALKRIVMKDDPDSMASQVFTRLQPLPSGRPRWDP
jgi:hypothetical protein